MNKLTILLFCPPKAVGSAPYSYPWPPWRHAQHCRSLPNSNGLTLQLIMLNYTHCWPPPITNSSVFYPVAPVQLFYQPRKRCLWHYVSARWKDLRIFSDFSWNDYCSKVRDSSMCTQHITEVIVFEMAAHIPQTLFTLHARMPWFNHAC